MSKGELHQAVMSGNPGYLLTYLATHRGLDVDIRDESGDTALLCAADVGNVTAISILLAHGADPFDGCHDDHECAIHRAASTGHVNVLKVLLKEMDVNLQDHYGNTALSKAVAENRIDAVKLLLEHEPEIEDCNEDNLTPLDIAVIKGHETLVEILLENGATVTSEGHNNETTLHYAADHDDAYILGILLQWCTAEDINALDENNQTPLHRTCQVQDSPSIGLLLDYDVDVNVKDKWGLTPLHLVAEQGNAAGAELLLAHGADVHATDSNQKTPLALAAMQGRMFFCGGSSNLDPNSHEEIIKILLDDGAGLETADTCGLTPLYLAAERGCINAAMEMIQHDAKVNIVDMVDSSTPLHHAVRHGSKRLVSALLEAGAFVDAVDSMGNRPLDVIPQNVEPGCTILHDLLKHGAEYRKHNYSRFSVTLQIRRVCAAGILLLMHGASLKEFHAAGFGDKTLWCSDLLVDHPAHLDLLLKHRTYLEICSARLTEQNGEHNGREEHDGKEEHVNDAQPQSGIRRIVLSLLNLSVVFIREHLVHLQRGQSIWKAICCMDIPKPSKNALLLRHLDTKGELHLLK